MKLPRSIRVANGTLSSASFDSDDSDQDHEGLMKPNKKSLRNMDSASTGSRASNAPSIASKVT